MTPERWRQLEALHDAVKDLAPAERSARLKNADPELRSAVEAILAQEGSLLERPAWENHGSLLETATVFSIGMSIGPYRIETQIGAGGMGEVYRATDTRLARQVAIKTCRQEFGERFQREARVIASLNHRHICSVYDVGPNYLVMELVEGDTLAAKLKRGPLPTELTLRHGGEIADALAAAHAKGVVHRDIKPGNIMLTNAGVKVLDFGLAKSPQDMTLTHANAVMGTPAYMAPEQREGRPCDTRTDIYALGLTLYEMATGKRFSTEEPASLDGLPEKLGHVIERCLAPQPEDRWQSASDVRNELMWAAKLPAFSQPGISAAASGKSAPTQKWRLVTAALAVATLAAGGWAIQHFRRGPAVAPTLRYQVVPPQGGQLALGTNPSAGGIAISPDATAVAMVATVDGRTSLWLSPLDGSAARPVAGTDNPDFPFWSPDSKSLGFFSGGALRKVDLATGAVLEICRTPGFGVGAAWMDDGTILFGELGSGLMRVPSSGGTPTLFTHLNAKEGERDHIAPQALPGGRFMYLAQHQARENNTIEAAKLDDPGKRERLVTSGFSALYASGYLLFQRGSSLMAQAFDPAASRLSGDPAPVAETFTGLIPIVNASVSANGVLIYDTAGPKSQLIWMDRRGQRLHPIGEPGNYGPARISSDGHFVVTQKLEPGGGADLWIISAETGVPRRLTSDARLDSTPIWSPDGRTVVFSDTREMFRVAVTGTAGEALLLSGTNLRLDTDWSRDGSTILYYERFSATRSDLGTLPVTTDGKLKEGAQPRPYLSTQADETSPRFAPEPNPRWVAYQSDESGKYEVYIDTFPERSAVVRVSTGGGTYPAWGPVSGDRSELFYVSGNSKLMAADLRLVQGRVEASPPHELFPLAPAEAQAGSSPFDAASDGQRFLVRTPADTIRPLTVVANWPTLVK